MRLYYARTTGWRRWHVVIEVELDRISQGLCGARLPTEGVVYVADHLLHGSAICRICERASEVRLMHHGAYWGRAQHCA